LIRNRPWHWKKLHIDQLSADYVDHGYLQRRNQFCAQHANIDLKQFTEQHVAAAQRCWRNTTSRPAATW